MTAYIYALVDPRTLQIRYVGKANDVNKRLQRHYSDAKTRNTPVYTWLRKLAREGLRPILTTLAVCEHGWQEMERTIIAKMRAAGAKLLNLADGGDEPYCSPEIRSELGRKAAELHKDPERRAVWEFKKRYGDALKDRHVRPETKEKLKKSMRTLGHVLPELFGKSS